MLDDVIKDHERFAGVRASDTGNPWLLAQLDLQSRLAMLEPGSLAMFASRRLQSASVNSTFRTAAFAFARARLFRSFVAAADHLLRLRRLVTPFFGKLDKK
jgi:hypothetical protein